LRCKGRTGAAELNGCLWRVVSHEGARARVLMDGPDSRVVGLRPGNLVVVVGLLDLLDMPDVFEAEVLRRLVPADRAVLAQVGTGFLAAEKKAAAAVGTWMCCSGTRRSSIARGRGGSCI